MATTPVQDDIDLGSLGRRLRTGLPKLLVASALAGALTYAALSLIAPRYASESQLAIVARSTNPFPEGRERGGVDSMTPRMDKEAINTHVRALMGSDLMLKVARELDLRDRPEFNDALGAVDEMGRLLRMIGIGGPRPGESEDDRVLSTVYNRLEVAAAKDSRFIPIRFTSNDPDLAANFANALAETYRKSLVSVPVQETSDVVDALVPAIDKLRAEVIEAESGVERYRASTDQFRGGAQNTPVTEQRMAALNDELVRAEAQRSEADARWRTAKDLTQAGGPDLVPDVQKSPLIQNLLNQRVRLERQIAEASATLLPGHPRMQQLAADLAGLKRQIAGETQKIVQSIEKDSKAAALRVQSAADQIAQLKTKVVGSSGNEARLKSLEATARSKRAELERLQKQLEDNKTLVVTKSVPVEAQVISRARASSVPSYPKKGPLALLATAATLLLGVAAMVTRELVSGSRTMPGPVPAKDHTLGSRELTPHLALPASLRSERPAEDSPLEEAIPVRSTKASPASAARKCASMRDAARHLVREVRREGGVRTLIVGHNADVDVSGEAIALAAALSGMGKQVLLIDWALDGTGFARENELGGQPGVSELIEGTVSFESAIARLPQTDVHTIPCGKGLSHPRALLDGDHINLLLDALDEVYEHIVVAAAFAAGQELFEAIQGRFDAGIVVRVGRPRAGEEEPANTFLGFEVNGMEILRYTRAGSSTLTKRSPALQLERAGSVPT